MKRFVGAFMHLFDNDVQMVEVTAENELEAMHKVADEYGEYINLENIEDVEEFKELCFAREFVVSIKEV